MYPSFGRGSGGRGQSNQYWSRFSTRGFNPTSEPELPPKGTLIETLKLASLKEDFEKATADESHSPKIKDVQFVASYNWVANQRGRIIIPGAPPRWAPPQIPPRLSQDDPHGTYYRDINAAHWPKLPFEPAVRAIYHMKPDFDASEIDVVGCGNALGNLLRFASSQDRTFHFKAQKVGNTLFLIRQDKSPTELIRDVRGYGHTFPEAYTSWDQEVKNTDSHQRIVKFKLAGLKILVRSEADGYLKEKANPNVRASEGSSTLSAGAPVAQSSSDIAGAISTVAIASGSMSAPTLTVTLTIQKSDNDPITQQSIFDLKTRWISPLFSMDEMLPRLWLNRTENFVLAQHTGGVFNKEDIQVKDIKAEVDTWEEEHATELRQFCALLKKLLDLADRMEGEKKFGVWRIGGGDLQVRTLGEDEGDWTALPADLRKKWSQT